MEYEDLTDFRERAGYEIGGVWYPRVTSIVTVKAKPALYRFYGGAKSFAEADRTKEASAAEGSRVHEAVEAILQGAAPDIGPDIAPSVEAFTAFLRNHQVTPLMVESRVVSRAHRFAGTVDVVAEIDGTVGVLDIKTGKSVYRDYGLQTAAYAAALREDAALPQVEASWVLRLDQARPCRLCGATLRTKGGTFRVKGNGVKGCTHSWGPMTGQFEFIRMEDQDGDFRAFLAAKTLWEWEHRSYLEQLAASV